MANTLGVYNPVFYAQEALIQLEKALGMASRVYMGYDQERRAFGLGETINIRRPSTFTVDNAPATAQDVTTETVAMTLDNWREVKFKLSDKELAFTGERIISDHIRPAAYALADDIDQKLAALYLDVGRSVSGGTWDKDTIPTKVRKPLFDAQAPLSDVGNLHLMVDGATEAELLGLEAFAQYQGGGDTGVSTQMRGTLGTKYGFEVFANQNVVTGVASGETDLAGAVDNVGGYAKGTTTVHIDDVANETYKAGTGVSFSGHPTVYSLSADLATGGTEADFVLRTGLQESVAQDEAVTFHLQYVGAQNLGFHRNAFGLAMAPLSEMGNELGANIATVSDPVTGLSLRSRVYYVGDSSEVHVALDVLYGVKTLDGNLAVRIGD
tara:strand:+ start:1196 stop:2341 length:1146 start_codon:yes stop_codon:yes gene_type:complete